MLKPKTQAVTRLPEDMDADERALHDVLLRLFGRTPTDTELASWLTRLEAGMSARQFVDQVSRGRGFLANSAVRTKNPAGHFYSPVVDPDQVRGYVERERAAGLEGVAGIAFPLEDMARFWQANLAHIQSAPFADTDDGVHRYCYEGGPYNGGDGTVLWTMIHQFRPRRIIEIGSGYSSACMLDTADYLRLAEFHLTCIEPNPERLFSILRPDDAARMTIHRCGVQDVDPAVFDSLERDDILFIDSSHVLKTGSDVHFELFHILPRLKPGVVVHFHDCRFPFEYSDRQIFVKNYSWNEVYAVRALLMYSSRFRVIFHGSLFAEKYPELARLCLPFRRNPGSALWVQVQS